MSLKKIAGKWKMDKQLLRELKEKKRKRKEKKMNENEMQFSLKIYLFNCLCNDVDKREIKRLLKAIVISEIFGSPQADSAEQSRAKFIANFCVAAAAAAAQCVFLSSNTWHGNWVGCWAGQGAYGRQPGNRISPSCYQPHSLSFNYDCQNEKLSDVN